MKDWYFHQEGGTTRGPIDLDEIKDRVRAGRIRATDLIFRDGDAGWRMAFEYSDLRTDFKPDDLQALNERPWVILQRKGQGATEFKTSGPFSETMVKEGLMSGKYSYSDYIWKDGFKEWRRIGAVEVFNRRIQASIAGKTAGAPPPVPGTDLLKNVVEFRRHKLPEPEPPPPEALGDNEPTVVHAPILPPTPSHEEEEETVIASSPGPGPVPESAPEEPVIEVGEKAPKVRKALWVDVGIVATLVLILIGAIFAVSKYISAPPAAPVVESAPVAEVPVPTSNGAGVPVKEEPPPPAPAKVKGPAPTELVFDVQTVSSNQVRIELKTDASAAYPVYMQIVGLPGQVTDGASFYRYLRFIPKGEGLKQVDLTGVKMPQGKFILRVSTGNLRREAKMNVGTSEPVYKQIVARLRKQHAHAIWKERLALFRLSQNLEKAIQAAGSGKKIAAKPFAALLGVTRGNGENYVMFDFWFELKEILQDAQADPSPAVLERARKARERLASFSVWK